MSQEVRREEAYPNISPWDILVWKIDALEKYIQRENENIRREINDIRQELKDVRQGLKDVQQKVDGYQQKIEQELRTVRHSFTVLELTAILGFAGIITTIVVAAKFF